MRGLFTTAYFLFAAGYAIAQSDSLKNVTTQEVTITGTRAGANDPTTFQNISAKDIQKNNLGQDLPYMLDLTPSLVTTSDAGTGVGYTGMRIRGTDATRINVTVNGVPMNEPDDQSVYWVDMPDIATSTESIQIQRGVGTSTNGSGAFGASVNMKTDAISLKPFGDVTASFGSFNTRKFSAKGGSGLIKNIFFVEARGSYVASDGYVDRASANLWSYFVQAGIVKNKTMLRFVHFNGHEKTYQAWNGVSQDSLATNRTYNVSGFDYGASPIPWYNQVDIYQKQYFQLVLNQGLGHNWNMNAVAFLTLGKGYYEEYKVGDALANYGIIDSTVTNANLLRHKWLKNRYAGGVFSFNYNNNKSVDATIGGMYANFAGNYFGNVTWVEGFTNFNPNADYYLNKFHKNEANVYARANYSPVNVLSLYADMQYRFVEMGAHGLDDAQMPVDFSRTYHFFNPKGGISVKTGKIGRVYASYALAHREPVRDDIIQNLNGTAPRPEKLHDIEAGIDITNAMVKSPKVWVNFPVHLNGYYMYYVDQLVLTGALNDVGDPLRVNVPQSFRAGAELLAEINFNRPETTTKLFGIRYSVSYNLSKIKNYTEVVPAYDSTYSPVTALNKVTTYPNTDIAFSPRWVGFVELNTIAVKNLEIAWAFKFIGKQYLDNTQSDERSLRRYWYSNIRVSYLLKIKSRAEVRFTMLFNNIFNRLYESNGYTYRERYQNSDGSVTDPVSYNYYYPQAGFNVMGGINVRF
ncbi:MAG: TonB-dependent receptor plug domain-containing protein [Bacteroidetes bacterium]|nr:TonB-dependent receptor plug domain-containing protein [Bacteroidota bacterium]